MYLKGVEIVGTATLDLFHQYSQVAVLLSIMLNVLIAVSGFLPSYFLTAANIFFFGFWPGTLLSFFGEAIGAFIAFLLYRKGFKRMSREKLGRYRHAKKLIDLKGRRAFLFIFSLRLMPFMPSGIVTFFSAVGMVSVWVFLVASTIGKIPALLLESTTVHHILEWNGIGKVILLGISLTLLYGLWTTLGKKNTRR